jgi:hypothetical protein
MKIKTAKRRPALVIAVLQGDDVILCQITSQTVADRYAITIGMDDFSFFAASPTPYLYSGWRGMDRRVAVGTEATNQSGES